MSWLQIDEPRDSDIHTIADFMEILCLTSIDKEISLEDLEDHLRDNSNSYLNSEDKKFDINEQINWRSEAFIDKYPFIVDGHLIKLNSDLSLKNKVYIFLLISANLPLITDKNSFTKSFEDLSLLSLIEMTGSKAESKVFARNTQHFTGSKPERLNELFEMTGNIGHCKPSDFRPRDSGDGGIDLVSYYKADHYESGNIMSILAQCACSRSGWSKKQNDASYDRLCNLVQVNNRWNNMLFTPICFRDNNGNWPFKAEVQNNILFDRLRIVNFLEYDNIGNFPFPDSFDEMIIYSRELTE
jgi:hypothetical protein